MILLAPLWPYGKSSYKQQFTLQPPVPEEMYSQPSYGYPYNMGPYRQVGVCVLVQVCRVLMSFID
jgi:hypothetical protein